jgi:hypothetical protein
VTPTLALLAALLLGPAKTVSQPTGRTFDRTPGFTSIVLGQLGSTIGLDVLPDGDGAALEPGMFVTIGLEHVWMFDREIAQLALGQLRDRTMANECARRCPASLFDAFQAEWLALAIEATQRSVEIPSRVAIAAHNRLPAYTLLETVYAVASSRPLRPPELVLVIGGQARGLRGQPFFVLPPQGLELGQGSAALGLQVHFGRTQWRIRAEDPQFVRELKAESTARLGAALREVKKRFPSKSAIVLVPDETVSVADLVATMAAVRAEFPVIVLSAGQDLILP